MNRLLDSHDIPSLISLKKKRKRKKKRMSSATISLSILKANISVKQIAYIFDLSPKALCNLRCIKYDNMTPVLLST